MISWQLLSPEAHAVTIKSIVPSRSEPVTKPPGVMSVSRMVSQIYIRCTKLTHVCESDRFSSLRKCSLAREDELSRVLIVAPDLVRRELVRALLARAARQE